MQFMLIFYGEDGPGTPEADMAAWGAYIGSMFEAGIAKSGEELHDSAKATTLSIRDGQRHVADGPYADTKEQIGGFMLIDVPDLDAALDWAAKCPAALDGHVEVRPIVVHAEEAEAPR